jgi:xanthine dehydrogenase molybdopterin-binding subunit B
MDYSENKPIWPGSSSFTTGSTPFGFFDGDPVFRNHADRFAKASAQHLGYPIMDVEMQAVNFYTAFESAVIEYSNQVNQVNIVNNLMNTLVNSRKLLNQKKL